MSAEKRFFESLLAKASPSWAVTMAPTMEPGKMDLASLTVRVYVVDTSNGWTAGGCMSVPSLEKAKAFAKSHALGAAAICNDAGQMIAELSKANTAGHAPEVGKCLQLTAAAITTTQAFKLVEPQGLAGHWLYIVYRCHDGAIVGRPMYFNVPVPGLVDAASLMAVARHIALQDLANAGSAVAREVKKGGGAQLAPAFV